VLKNQVRPNMSEEPETKAIAVQQPYSEALRPRNIQEAMTLSEMLAKSSFVPPTLRNKPGDVFAALAYGSELGLAPLTALHTVAVVNGKPSLFGDGLLAVCQAHGSYEWHKEHFEGEGETLTAVFTGKRRGNPEPSVTRFSVADAKKAGLWGKSGPWTQYGPRMLQMRARGFGLRDLWSDAIKGVISQEEAQDFPTRNEPPVKAEVVTKQLDAPIVHQAVIDTYSAKAGTNTTKEEAK